MTTTALPVLVTEDKAKHEMAIALTNQSIFVQNLHDEAASLIFNEDQENLDKISEFLKKGKKAIKIVVDTHGEKKKSYFDAGKCYDKAKNETVSEIELVITPTQERYNEICSAIEKRKLEAEQEIAKNQQILAGVESNILEFSTKIAACITRQQLVDVERLINLEKSPTRAEKYGKHHDFAKKRYEEVLIPILKDQKIKIDEKEELERKLSEATDPTKADELKAQLENKENEITQNQVKVQENAMAAINIQPEVAEEIFPDLTKQGSLILCEIVDEKKVFQKQRQLLNIELKLIDAKKLAATLRDSGAFGSNNELIVDGIKFTIQKKWK